MKNSRPKRTVYSKKYGCDLVQYTHAPNTIIYTSNKIDGKHMYILHVFEIPMMESSRLKLNQNGFVKVCDKIAYFHHAG